MITEYTSTHPITAGAIHWPSGHQRVTVVAKLSLVLGRDETFRFGETPEPLCLDRLNDQGELVYPSDFAPYKPRCDLAIVGHAIPDRLEPGLLAIGALRKNAEARETLGPRETFCMGGDPTEPAAVAVWSTGGVDFSRFQSAPPDRRIEWPTMAFQVDYWRSAVRVSGRFEGPVPRASLVSADGSRVVARIPLAMDTVLLDPLLRQLTLVFRGVYAGGEMGRVAFDLTGNPLPDLRSLATREVATLATPASSRRIAKAPERPIRMSDETQYMASTPSGNALPFSPAKGRAAALDQTAVAREQDLTKTVDPSARGRASTLPFKRGTTPSQSTPLTGAELAALRAEGANPIRSAWEADGETAYARPSRAPRVSDEETTLAAQAPRVPIRAETPRTEEPRVVPQFGQVDATPSFVASRAPSLASSPPVFASPLGGSPLGRRPESAIAAPPPVASSTESDEARVQEILQEVWKGERALSDILSQHGLTEVEWRILKRSHKKR